jgi:hypothetical protein
MVDLNENEFEVGDLILAGFLIPILIIAKASIATGNWYIVHPIPNHWNLRYHPWVRLCPLVSLFAGGDARLLQHATVPRRGEKR